MTIKAIIFPITSLIISICSSVTYLESSAVSGRAAYYEGSSSENECGYATVATATFPFGYYAACGGTIFDTGYGCGKCYEITCIGPYDSSNTGCSCSSTTPSVIISCMDQCSECSATHFDLNPTAMARIVGPGLSGTCGVIETQIRRVSCEYTTNLKIRAKTGTSATWYGLHIDNIAGYGSVKSVQLKSSGSSSYGTTCDKSQGPSFWICSGYPLTAPLTVKLTNDNNEAVEFIDCITNLNGGAEFDCGGNFGGGGTQTPTAITSSPVPQPTASPISGSSCSKYVKFTMQSGSQLWWLAFYIDDLCCGTVSKVEVKDSTNYLSFVTGVDSTYGYWQFDNADYGNKAFTANITVRITNSNGEVLTFVDVLETVDPGNVYYGDTNFCESTTKSGTSNYSQLSFGILFVCCSFIFVLFN